MFRTLLEVSVQERERERTRRKRREILTFGRRTRETR
jgi:hypothetical protein